MWRLFALRPLTDRVSVFWMMLSVLVARIWIDSNLVQNGPTTIQRQEFGVLAKLALTFPGNAKK